MMLNMYSIRDAKAEIFGPPFFKVTHGEVERDFRHLVNDEKSKIHLDPEDYDLYHMGRYDDNTGKFELLPSPQHMIKAIQVIAKKPKSLESLQ